MSQFLVLMDAAAVPGVAQAGELLNHKIEQFQCVAWEADSKHLERCIIKVHTAFPVSESWSRAACYGEIVFQSEQWGDTAFRQGFVLSAERPTNGHLPDITFMNSIRLGGATDVTEANWNGALAMSSASSAQPSLTGDVPVSAASPLRLGRA